MVIFTKKSEEIILICALIVQNEISKKKTTNGRAPNTAKRKPPHVLISQIFLFVKNSHLLHMSKHIIQYEKRIDNEKFKKKRETCSVIMLMGEWRRTKT